MSSSPGAGVGSGAVGASGAGAGAGDPGTFVGTFVIAIDGPAGTGKSTVARQVAQALAAGYLDTGAMYRIVTLAVLDAGVDPEDESAVAELLPHLTFDSPVNPGPQHHRLGGRDVSAEIRGPLVTLAVTPVSANPAVRAYLLGRQRYLARSGRMVVEGRDIGTVVVPDADLKIYLTADADERARRRYQQNTRIRARSGSGAAGSGGAGSGGAGSRGAGSGGAGPGAAGSGSAPVGPQRAAGLAQGAGSAQRGESAQGAGSVHRPAPAPVHQPRPGAARTSQPPGTTQTADAAADLAAVAFDLDRRDTRDSTRAHAPLQAAEDAVVIDSSELEVGETVARVLALARERGIR